MRRSLAIVAGMSAFIAIAGQQKSQATLVPKIVIYGDSYFAEAASYSKGIARRKGHKVLVRAFPGVAICDFFPYMKTDREKPDVVSAVIAFAGKNNFTPCMSGSVTRQEITKKYKADGRKTLRKFGKVGIPVLFLPPPPPVGAVGQSKWVKKWQNVVDESPYYGRSVDSGALFRINDISQSDMPCLRTEVEKGLCGYGVIRVRAPDGWHFCPVGLFPCPYYSSGAKRYAKPLVKNGMSP